MVFKTLKNLLAQARSARRPMLGNGRRLRVEPLEDRRLLSLLGLLPASPSFTYDASGTVDYNPAVEALSFNLDATPLTFKTSPTAIPKTVSAPKDFGIKDFRIFVTVDNAGNLLGGVPGDDLYLTGMVDLGTASAPNIVSGTLLTAEVSQFGFLDTGTNVDMYDFRFTPTGGLLQSYFVGKDLAVTTTSENSTFTGSFETAFHGGAKGNLGVVDPLLSSLAGYVYDDGADNDGIKQANEAGIPGTTIALTGTNVDGVAVNLTTATDANGAYSFTGLRPGSYTVTETQPANYFDGLDAKNNLPIPGSRLTDAIDQIMLSSGQDASNNNFGELLPAKLSGFVWLDANDDGEIDFNETAIANVKITLTGTDDCGNSVNVTDVTDAQGGYEFANLRPGNYTITETQPAGYADGKDSIGTQGGIVGNDQFSNIALTPGTVGINNNFGERPTAVPQLSAGMTATIGFWHNKNGQALIKSLNGSSNSVALGNWLAASFPNMYGATAGANALAGKSNAYVASYFLKLFDVKGQKLEAQVLAMAFAAYATDSDLAGGTMARGYGFTVNTAGTGTATYNVGANGAAFGVANNTRLSILEVLNRINDRSRKGVLWDLDGNSVISSSEQVLRNMGNVVCTGINETGDIC